MVERAPYSFFWHRYSPKATENNEADETSYNSERNYSHPSTEDVTEEVCAAKEPALLNDVGYEEKEKVIEADSSEDITSTTEDVSEEEFAEEEEPAQFTFNSQLCPAPGPALRADDGETDMKQEEQEHESSISSVLKQDEIESAPCTEEITVDQVCSSLEQNLPSALPNSSYEQQTDMPCNDATGSTAVTAEVMDTNIIQIIHSETCESEPLELVDVKDNGSLASTADVNAAADLSSSNEQESEPPAHLTFQTEMDQNGLFPQELSHFETNSEKSPTQKDTEIVNTDCTTATSENGQNISNLDAISDSIDVKVMEAKSLETEAFLLSENKPAVQNQQSSENFLKVQSDSRPCTENSATQKDEICNDKQPLLICEENNLTSLDQKEGQSSNVDSSHEECLVHLPTSQSELHEVMIEETGLSGVSTGVEEISTVTDTETVQTTEQKQLEGTPDMDTETNDPKRPEGTVNLEAETIAPPSHILQNKSTQTYQKDESIDASNISPSTRDKIESMVEQMVAEVYNDVTQTALEKPMQLVEIKSSELVQDNDNKSENTVEQTVAEDCNDMTQTAVEVTSMQLEERAQDKDGKIESLVEQMVADIYKDVTRMTLEAKSMQLSERKPSECPQENNSKIESLVEQMVTEVCKDVTQMALETKPMQVEEIRPLETVQDNDSVAPDNLSIKEVEKEVDFSSDVTVQAAEEVEISNSCLSNNTKAAEVQKVALVDGDASENPCSNDNNIPVTETVPNPEESDMLEGAQLLEMNKNVPNEISVTENTPLVQQMVPEVKSTQLAQHSSIEQLVELVVQPILDFNDRRHEILSNESELPISGQETPVVDACSNIVPEMKVDETVPYPEFSNSEKVGDEEKIQSGLDGETAESVETSQFEHQIEEKTSNVVLNIDRGLSNNAVMEDENGLLEKESGLQEITSLLKEGSENLAALDDLQKQSGMLLDTSNNLSNTAVKSSKVVIVCRTLEASVSTTEMSDSEDDVYDETSYLELTSSKNSYQDHIKNSVNENQTDEVSTSSETLAVQRVMERMSTEEKQFEERDKSFNVTSVALDIPQNGSTSMESAEPSEQKDDATCTPSLESGICSLTVSPEEEESSEVIGQDTLTTCQINTKEKVSLSVLTSNGLEPVAMETSCSLQISVLDDDVSDELSMTNEDSFGSEIEDGYHKATEEIMTQVVDSIKDESKDLTKEIVENVKKEQACVTNKENGEKVDSDKTEISIMEATMDHNEWITDGNYPVLPWMTAAGFSKDPISSKEAKDVVENKPQPQTSSAEESVENAKKVLAVQPMPQNVNVTFRVHYVTLTPHQTVALTGDQPELGAWKSVIPLEKTKDGYWTCVVGLPAESQVEWKFVVLEKGEVCRWEECGNRLLYTGFGDDLLVHKWWGFL